MLEEIRRNVSSLLRDLRSLERITNSESLARAMDAASPIERNALTVYLEECLTPDHALREICFRNLKREINRLNAADWNIRDLKDKASSMGIPRWSRMTKDELLVAIMQKESNVNGSDCGTSDRTADSPAGSGA